MGYSTHDGKSINTFITTWCLMHECHVFRTLQNVEVYKCFCLSFKGSESVPASQKVTLPWDPYASDDFLHKATQKLWRVLGRSLCSGCSVVGVWGISPTVYNRPSTRGFMGRQAPSELDFQEIVIFDAMFLFWQKSKDAEVAFSPSFTHFFLFYVIHYVKENILAHFVSSSFSAAHWTCRCVSKQTKEMIPDANFHCRLWRVAGRMQSHTFLLIFDIY